MVGTPSKLPDTQFFVGPDGGLSLLRRNAGGTLQVSNDGGSTFVDAAGGGGANPFSAPLAFIAAKVSTLTVPVFIDEMNAVNPNWTFAASGTATFLGQNTPGGVCRITAGTSATLATARNIGAVVGAVGGDFVANVKTDPFALYVRAKAVLNPGGSDVRVCNIADEANYNMGLGLVGSANWQLRLGAGNTDLGAPAGLLWHDLLIISDGTNLFTYVDYVLLNTTLLSGLSAAFAHSGHINLLCGTTNCAFDVDKVLVVTAAAA
jgi:hypothetical protein